jgi:rhodanese-related sulfurtransferase
MPTLTFATITTLILGLLVFLWMRRGKDRDDLERHSITAEELYSLLAARQELLIFDVRQPLDLLAYPEIIPSAQRIPPDEVLAMPSVLPRETYAVVYCTCPSDKTSRVVLRQLLDLRFLRVKFLKGGLEAWKTKGYPVEPYKESFHLYASSSKA